MRCGASACLRSRAASHSRRQLRGGYIESLRPHACGDQGFAATMSPRPRLTSAPRAPIGRAGRRRPRALRDVSDGGVRGPLAGPSAHRDVRSRAAGMRFPACPARGPLTPPSRLAPDPSAGMRHRKRARPRSFYRREERRAKSDGASVSGRAMGSMPAAVSWAGVSWPFRERPRVLRRIEKRWATSFAKRS